jgi:hypothetical protein
MESQPIGGLVLRPMSDETRADVDCLRVRRLAQWYPAFRRCCNPSMSTGCAAPLEIRPDKRELENGCAIKARVGVWSLPVLQVNCQKVRRFGSRKTTQYQ